MASITKYILFEHFSGRSSPLQKRAIEHWLQTPQNQELFYSWLVEWENEHPLYAPELSEAARKYSEYVRRPRESDEREVLILQSRTNRLLKNRFMAAAIILLMISAGIWLGRDHFQYEIYKTTYGTTHTIDLIDGTKVTLNANSTLKVPRFVFGKKSREVFLDGEAYFVVSHTKDNMKFLVKTSKNMDVIVLGTEFNVYARSNATRVMLNKGKVKINYLGENKVKQITLKPGDLAVYNKQKDPVIQSHVETEKYTAWKEHRFIFEDMTLREFGELLEQNYGLEVEMQNDELSTRRLVGSFQAENADELLESVSEVFNLKVTRKGNKVLLLENN